MKLTSRLIWLLELASAVSAAPASADSQSRRPPLPDIFRAIAVKRAFQTSWEGYYENAFPHDTLHPVSNGYEDDRAFWGVTVVDALSTAIIMGDVGIVIQMLEHIKKIDFTKTSKPDEKISLFETNIRYLGGLLAGHDLLHGPMKSLGIANHKIDILLKQAKILGDTLSYAFDTPSGVPDGDLYIYPKKHHGTSGRNSIAGIGTLVLEWTRLSDLTGDPKYAKLVKKAQSYLIHPTGSPEAFPGLIGSQVSLKDGTFLNSAGGWSGGTDSFYEYLIKMYLYDPEEFEEYKDRWVLAADSTMKHLASHPTSRKDLTYLSQFNGNQTDPSSGHLASFAGGNFILGGILLNEDKYKKFGLELTTSYFNTYEQTPVGIGPEGFRWIDSALPADDPHNKPVPASQKDFYSKSGFYTTSGAYILRPETLESVYYAYRLTGDRKWQDMAWKAFQSIQKACRTGSAYGELQDVMKPDGGGFYDQMQSFWMAETLKYLYLIFAPESEVQLQGQGRKNHFVYNTEAHPVRVRG